MALALSVQANSFENHNDFTNELTYRLRELRMNEEIGDKVFLANNNRSIGFIYAQQGDHSRSIDYFLKSLKLFEELKDDAAIPSVINGIGIIYGRMKDYEKALEYYQRSLKMSEEMGDKTGIAGAIINIGIIYQEKNDLTQAFDHFQRGLKLAEEAGQKRFIANALSGLGKIHAARQEYHFALDYFQRSISIQEELGVKTGITTNLVGIGTMYNDKKEHKTAIEWCKKALVLAEEIQAINRQKESCTCLYDAYKALGKQSESLLYLEKIGELDKQLQSDETKQKLQQMEFTKVIQADSIAQVEKARLVREAHQAEVSKKNQTRNWLIGSTLLLMILAGGLYSRWRYVRKSRDIIAKERDRSDNLLLNILPEEIAAELKEKGRANARDFEMVSILFTDFKGFTEASAKLSAQDLVAEINACFEAFDGIMAKYGIEKIKTIGDAYMAAGGLPVPTDDSVKNTVRAALEMQAFIKERKTANETLNKPAFEMRVGIHTGPVVAGIVGVKKFQYDIWGDTVNTASGMESNGEVGRVNISQNTFELLRNDQGFVFENRGMIEAKGKGEVQMYFVELS